MTRTKEQINKDYSDACAQLGDLHFKEEVIKLQKTQLLQAIEKLNNEMNQLVELEKKLVELKAQQDKNETEETSS